MQLVAHELDHLQTGVIRFHDHIEQQQGDIRGGGEQGLGLGGRIGVQKIDGLAVELKLAQGNLGDAMHLGLIVHYHHLPAGGSRCCLGQLFIVNNQDLIIHYAILFVILCLP
ncbi:hypothetical protein D3C77_601830 [compost metagenome]